MASSTVSAPTNQNIATSPSEMSQQMQQQVDRAAPNEAATKLIESIDDFLGDIEKKFTTISEEILGKLDDMAERCDRLEQEMLLGGAASRSSPTAEDAEPGVNSARSNEDKDVETGGH